MFGWNEVKPNAGMVRCMAAKFCQIAGFPPKATDPDGDFRIYFFTKNPSRVRVTALESLRLPSQLPCCEMFKEER